MSMLSQSGPHLLASSCTELLLDDKEIEMQSKYNFPNVSGKQAINHHLILAVCTIYVITVNLRGSFIESDSSL